ncbi:hypothetical protein CVT26_005376, partial [Gymnopilus dilepis]
PTPTPTLAEKATSIIADFALLDEHIFTFGGAEIALEKLFNAMLHYAAGAGGEVAQRYVLAAIVASNETNEGKGWVERLPALGITWLTHLLYLFKEKSSEDATPSFRTALLLRDGYECHVTGQQDFSHPSPTLEDVTTLEAAHIIRRDIADFDADQTSLSFKSAATTFDILVNFTCLPVEQLEDLKALIDDPSNGMLLERNAHAGFEALLWCLEKTDVNTYKVQRVSSKGTGLISRLDKDALVVFEDKSSQFLQAPSNSLKRSFPISLPDEKLIAIHAAIAGLMHMSGAGRFFDELFRRYIDDDDSTPLIQWIDLEKAVNLEETRDLLKDLQQIQVSS